jgi:hypothetical protein
MRKPTSWALFVLLGLTIIIGFYLRNESGHGTTVIHPLTADARDYYMYAYNMRHRQTYSLDTAPLSDAKSSIAPDALRSPGYPLFLSIFVDGPPNRRIIGSIKFVQMILSTLTLVIAFYFYRGFITAYWAVLAALLTSLSPHLIVANSYLLTETLFCLLLVISGWLLSLFFSRPSFGLVAVVGVTLGVATLVRPGLQYFPLVLGAIFIFHYGKRKGIYFFGVMLMGFVLILSPWFIRNVLNFHYVSDDKLKINFLHHGMYPDFKYQGLQKTYGFPYRFDPRSEEISKNTESILKEIRRRFRNEPVQHIKWYLIRKPAVFWSWNMIQGLGDVFVYPIHKTPYHSNTFFKWTHHLLYWLHWPMVILCAVGSFIVWLPGLKKIYPENSLYVARFVSGLLLYFTALHIIGAPFPRYSVPLRPFLYGMAVFCLQIFWTALKGKPASDEPIKFEK